MTSSSTIGLHILFRDYDDAVNSSIMKVTMNDYIHCFIPSNNVLVAVICGAPGNNDLLLYYNIVYANVNDILKRERNDN
jgi:hypothetical protein